MYQAAISSRCSFSVTSVMKGEITNVIDSDSMQEVYQTRSRLILPKGVQLLIDGPRGKGNGRRQ